MKSIVDCLFLMLLLKKTFMKIKGLIFDIIFKHFHKNNRMIKF